ncbi:MAG: putative transporter, permease protein [Fibrobacteria bacterium]|jgi:peptide/nickel transport system permease protein|nr:putative transporter, permease protein [Fibrobacteria bacterium]
MISFLPRRLLHALATLFGITLLIFALFHWVGGNPAIRMVGKNATVEEIARVSRQMGFDRPFWTQYLDYLGDLVRFDFGRSWETRQRVSEMILDGLGPSLSLAIPAFLLGTVVALTVALTAALYRDRWPDRTLVMLAIAGMSVSMLAFIIAAQYLFAFRAGWFPISGWEPGLRGVPFLALPVGIWIAASLGSAVRFYRAVFIEEMRKEYVLTARAKGLAWPRILTRHVLPNAMIPVLTHVVMELPMLFTGSLLLENFFGIPGLGNMSINAINASDLPVIKAMTFIGAVLYLGANILGDVLYAVVDPRVRVS